MLHPRLEVKPRKLDFKKVHLQSPKEMFVMLSNPTNVDAAWAVTEAKEEAAAAAAAAGGGSASAQPTPRSASGGNLAGEASAADSRAASAVSGASRPATMDGAAAAAGAPAGGVPPPPRLPGAAGPGTMAGVTGIIAEARIGPYLVKPASGVLPGRGLGMPRSQRISITFAPTEAEAYEGELIFAVLRGKQCSVDVDGEGSIEETDETKGNLFVI
ncbi:hypothetical protein HXX76_016240 [Chlamydomonas incerta]|uniref:Uncharacterized protein n=1 Tax=Chlamydomonas incerta TaxID=51695 RepID=A0A835SAS0_CHLIN|nr:hypothetical protein HXX76_016240 [Chlamydomonas incerta]|eukprot:KAG2422161.1 hypothetical protein HXX76_016240 [Chlamydomonas incerta]